MRFSKSTRTRFDRAAIVVLHNLPSDDSMTRVDCKSLVHRLVLRGFSALDKSSAAPIGTDAYVFLLLP